MTEQNRTEAPAVTPAVPDSAQASHVQGQTGETDANKARWRVKLEREIDNLKSENAKLKEAQMSEQEKAIAEARRAASTEVESRLRGEMTAKEIRAEIKLKLAEKGIPANQVSVIMDSDHPETIEDAAAAAEKHAQWWNENVKPAEPPKFPGQGGSPGPRVPPKTFTREEIAKMSPAEYREKFVAVHESLAEMRRQKQ